jgi:hypothetical protein
LRLSADKYSKFGLSCTVIDAEFEGELCPVEFVAVAFVRPGGMRWMTLVVVPVKAGRLRTPLARDERVSNAERCI